MAGGLFESVRHLSLETQKHGVELEVLGTQDKFSIEDAGKWSPLQIRVFPIIGPERFAFSPKMSDYLNSCQTQVVHLHGVWQYSAAAVLRWSKTRGRPYLVSSHGMLEPWALQRSRFKKAAINWLFQNKVMQEATCLRATAVSEIESFRRAGLRNPVALIRNGVPFPAKLPVQNRPPGRPPKRALFVSRIHPKKGLLNLVRAWSKIDRKIAAEWELVIVGPDEGGHLAEVMELIQARGLKEKVLYEGEIWDESSKMECYVNADLFILPSYSENFGLVIAEALCCGVAVITTRATPWEELEIHHCGWWIDTGEEPLFHALTAAFATPLEKLREMGLRGRDLIEAKYSWKTPGREMAEVYEWVTGRRGRPECVFE